MEKEQNKTKEIKDKTIKIKESEDKKLNDELADYKDKYLRLYADFENARKRMEREKIEFVKYANEGIITQFLDVLDDLHRTVDAAEAKHQDYDAFLKGIEMIMKRIDEMLVKNGVKLIEANGKVFDPNSCEILLQEETEDQEDGIVLEELQRGYLLGEKVIRTAKVKVAKKK